ncbi:unnamed protein product [Ambrosiozyma monospora]|uniref:Unnamed protein product n=1 Tax=Ambrosiozyma monospora TaxID=43982 RepID=A0A9W6YPX3_AMBMO|nr:unnamed protein product [Ambrosiozyma monospora]
MGWFNSVLRSRLTGENLSNLFIDTTPSLIPIGLRSKKFFGKEITFTLTLLILVVLVVLVVVSGGDGGSASDDAIDVCLGTSLNDENFRICSGLVGAQTLKEKLCTEV